MHAVKVGWVGQTFALARCSDTQRKRSRNRISKEERKTLVEKFIKKYQKSNSGTFPSLNLTHKEVGGSFYTVREIVREIIQENRILGPGDSALKVLTLQDCDDQSSFESLYLDDVSTLSLAINGQTAEGSQMEGQYGYNEHASISEGVVATVDKLSVCTNSVSDVDESDETIASSSNRFIFPQNLDVVASGDESNHFRGNPFFHKSQDADKEASHGFGALQSEKEPYEQIFGKGHPYSSKDLIKLEEDYHIGASPATTASSSSDAILNVQSEADTSAESLHALFSPSVGVTGSTSFELSSSSLSPASENIIATESDGHINGASFEEVLTYSTVVAEPDIELGDTEISEEVALKTYDVSINLEKHSSPSLIKVVPSSERDGRQQDFKEKEVTDDSVMEKRTENLLVCEELREDGQHQGVVVSNIVADEVIPICKSPASGSSELSAMEISEGKVVISADKAYSRKESTLSGKSKESLAAYGTAPKHVASSTGFTEHTPVRSDGQLPADSSKPQNVAQADPFWDAIKKIFAAFVKFWTE